MKEHICFDAFEIGNMIVLPVFMVHLPTSRSCFREKRSDDSSHVHKRTLTITQFGLDVLIFLNIFSLKSIHLQLFSTSISVVDKITKHIPNQLSFGGLCSIFV